MGFRQDSTKLVSMLLLLLTPIAFLGFLVVEKSREDIEFSSKEIAGLQYFDAVLDVNYELSQEHSPDIQKLRAAAQSYNRDIASTFESQALLNALEQKPFVAERAIEASQLLMTRIADQSNLVLDPEIETYYLMDVLALRLPKIFYTAHRLSAQVNALQDGAKLTKKTELETLVLAGRLESLRIAVNASFESAFNGNTDGSLRKKLSASAQDFASNLAGFTSTAERIVYQSHREHDAHIFDTHNLMPEKLDLKDLGEKSHEIFHAGSAELTRLLEARVNQLKTTMWLSIGFSGCVSLIALALGIGILRSIVARLDDEVVFLAHHDALTSLPNRAHFTEQAALVLTTALANDRNFSVYFIDIDHFKSLNDVHGHGAGDKVIQIIAQRLVSVVGAAGMVSRMGGDEFVVAAYNLPGPDGAEKLAGMMLQYIGIPCELGDLTYHATGSIGVAQSRLDGETLPELLKSADLALYAAKADGRNRFSLYNSRMMEAAAQRARVEQHIRHALKEELFSLHFQPVFTAADSRLAGFEALLRLRDEHGKFVAPDTMIPIAEQTRLIVDIGQWVALHACKVAAAWPDHLMISINVSPIELEEESAARTIAVALEESGLDPARLEVEITETALLNPSPKVMGQLQHIKQLGVSIAVDDFGAGYSSFGYLWRFPFNKIKIDKSLTQALGAAESAVNVVFKSIVQLGRGLKMNVTAEGIETHLQQQAVASFGCQLAQGYLLGRPMEEIDLAGFVIREFTGEGRPAQVDVGRLTA